MMWFTVNPGLNGEVTSATFGVKSDVQACVC